MTRPLRTQVLIACGMTRLAHAALSSGRALLALAVSIVVHVTDITHFRPSRPGRVNRRAAALGAAARPQVVDLDLYRRPAARDDWRLWRP